MRPLRSGVETAGCLVVAALQVAFAGTALAAVRSLPDDVSGTTATLLEWEAMAFVVVLFALPVAVAVDELVFKKAAAAKKAKPATKDAEAAGKSAVVSLTPKVHDAFQAHYTHVFGRWAGWAHCLLFAPRLTTSSVTLPRE
uniref:Uncharacterized protein n=1 Tax=Neobodo designis TaxID=312471 RepID=A0A6U4S3I6_NEODS